MPTMDPDLERRICRLQDTPTFGRLQARGQLDALLEDAIQAPSFGALQPAHRRAVLAAEEDARDMPGEEYDIADHDQERLDALYREWQTGEPASL